MLDDSDGGYSLPFGPVLMSPKTMAEAVIENFITGPEFQKAATLKEVLSLFNSGPDTVAGAYGNKASDIRAYSAADIAPEKVFIVDTEGRLKSVKDGSISSYPTHSDRVNELYPPTGQ